jgi:DNA-binding NarL/FixJ family response regulator
VFGSRAILQTRPSHESPYSVFRIERACVQGFVDKRVQTADKLHLAIEAIRSNRTYFSESFLKSQANRHIDPLAFDKLLTDQQIIVLSMVADLIGDEAIAKNLDISERTVEAHRTAIMRKLNVHSRTELIRFARTQGFTTGSHPRPAGDGPPPEK